MGQHRIGISLHLGDLGLGLFIMLPVLGKLVFKLRQLLVRQVQPVRIGQHFLIVLIVQRPFPGRDHQKEDHDGSQDQADADIDNGLPAGIFLIGRRQDHVIVLHLPVGKRVLHLPALHIRLPGPGFYILHVAAGLLIVLIDLEDLI